MYCLTSKRVVVVAVVAQGMVDYFNTQGDEGSGRVIPSAAGGHSGSGVRGSGGVRVKQGNAASGSGFWSLS